MSAEKLYTPFLLTNPLTMRNNLSTITINKACEYSALIFGYQPLKYRRWGIGRLSVSVCPKKRIS